MRPHVQQLSRIADTLLMAYPNAGLPNELGEYDELPETTAALVRQWAEIFAQRIQACGKPGPEQLVERAYRLALGRPATDDEQKQMVQFIRAQSESYGSKDHLSAVAIADFCQLMLCLNEFIFID